MKYNRVLENVLLLTDICMAGRILTSLISLFCMFIHDRIEQDSLVKVIIIYSITVENN